METGNNNAAPTETANETVQSNKLKKRTKLSDVIMCCDKYSNKYRSKPGLPTCIYKLWNRLHHERKRQSCPVSCTDWRWRNWTSTTKQIAKEKSERRGEKKKKRNYRFHRFTLNANALFSLERCCRTVLLVRPVRLHRPCFVVTIIIMAHTSVHGCRWTASGSCSHRSNDVRRLLSAQNFYRVTTPPQKFRGDAQCNKPTTDFGATLAKIAVHICLRVTPTAGASPKR